MLQRSSTARAQDPDAVGIVVARGPAIVSRAALAYDATVDDAAKITTKIGQLAAVGIVARDGV